LSHFFGDMPKPCFLTDFARTMTKLFFHKFGEQSESKFWFPSCNSRPINNPISIKKIVQRILCCFHLFHHLVLTSSTDLKVTTKKATVVVIEAKETTHSFQNNLIFLYSFISIQFRHARWSFELWKDLFFQIRCKLEFRLWEFPLLFFNKLLNAFQNINSTIRRILKRNNVMPI